jgi:DNA-binding transcriptional MocR family regulator
MAFVRRQVLFVPGNAFMVGGKKSSWVRAAFSVASPEQIDTALSRLAALLRTARGLDSKL